MHPNTIKRGSRKKPVSIMDIKNRKVVSFSSIKKASLFLQYSTTAIIFGLRRSKFHLVKNTYLIKYDSTHLPWPASNEIENLTIYNPPVEIIILHTKTGVITKHISANDAARKTGRSRNCIIEKSKKSFPVRHREYFVGSAAAWSKFLNLEKSEQIEFLKRT